jgi:phage/plasmid-associated DNA primase
MPIYGKPLCIKDQIDELFISNTEPFKRATGGKAFLEGEFKFQDAFNFKNSAKLMYFGNSLPRTNDFSTAYISRWFIVDFAYTIPKSRQIPNFTSKSLATDDELSGLLNKAIAGAQHLLQTGRFSREESKEKIQQHYLRVSDPILAFTIDECAIEQTAVSDKKEIFDAYVGYDKKRGLPVRQENYFFKHLYDVQSDVQPYRPRHGTERSYSVIGIRLKTPDERKRSMSLSRYIKTHPKYVVRR